MEYTVNLYTVKYNATEDGAREILSEWHDELTGHARELADLIEFHGATEPSTYPDVQSTTWLSSEPYRHEYRGHWEETTVHNGDMPERLWIATINAVRAA